ncbi:MAG: DUF6326 family protein [Cytophagaceae bacterium]|nr:DUF6326 family protein [Cytophagaceae bacterium]
MDTKNLLSTLWVFLVLNFIFCDVFTLMYSEDLKRILTGEVDGILLDQTFLLSFAIIMELPMMMVLLARFLPRRASRPLHLVVSAFLTFVQAWSILAGGVTLHYWFFSIIEITACLSIFILAWRWKEDDNVSSKTYVFS